MVKEDSYKEVVKKIRFLDQTLLENEDELQHIIFEGDEANMIVQLKKALFSIFRAVDSDDLGVVSFKEALLILENAKFQLNRQEIENFRKMLDIDNNGLVEYKNFAEVGSWIVFGYFLKGQVEIKIRNKDEEFLIEAIMILYNHEIHEIARNIVTNLIELEEEARIPFE